MKRWNKFGVLPFLLLMQWLCSAQLAVASTYTYTYTGNDFTSGGVEPPYTVSDRITGSFTLSAPLGDSFSGLVTPISFSFTDGQQTITNSNTTHPYGSSFEYIDINTSSSGAILGWSIDLNGPLGYLQTTSADGGSDFAYLNATATYGVVNDNPGNLLGPATNGSLTRSFVSSTGLDTNACTITAPCATFATAYTQIEANGIIAALDPGKYGPVTITGPVTINGNGWAAITGPAQGNAITINAGSGNVILNGLELDGAGAAFNGVVFNSGGSLTINNCIVKDFVTGGGTTGSAGNGIWIAPTTGAVNFAILNTVAVNNDYAGISYAQPSGSTAATGAIDHVIATNNPGYGINVAQLGGSSGSAAVTISNSVVNNNGSSGINLSGPSYNVTIDRDEVSNNSTGVAVGANTSALLSRSVITNNSAYGVSNAGTANSSEDNRIYGNGNSDILGNTLIGGSPQ